MDPEQVVRAFMDDVLNGHNGDHAAEYLAEDMAWHGGTVGTVAGRENVAGLMTAVVTAIPDLKADLQDIVVQGDKVVTQTDRQRHPEGQHPRRGTDGQAGAVGCHRPLLGQGRGHRRGVGRRGLHLVPLHH